jgi:hypothetical protein
MRWWPCILAILLFLAVEQQLAGQGKLRFGVNVDPQLAWLRSTDTDIIDPDGSIFHMQAGIQMDYFFQENYAFILGFGINNLGGSLAYSDSIDYGNEEDPVWVEPGQRVKMNLQYLQLPLGLKLKTEELGYVTGFLQVGFNPMFNIESHITTDDGVYDKKSILEEGVKLFNLGYHVNVGVEYRLGGNTALVGGFRWTSCFTNVTLDDGSSMTTDAISLHLGLLF